MNLIRVLIIDDSPDDRFMLARALGKTGLPVQVLHVEDGAEGIEFLSRQGRFADRTAFPDPDIVLLDLKMPALDGFDVLDWLRQHPQAAPPRVVVLSGSELDLDMGRARELGATGYLIKPATPDQLRALLTQPVPAKTQSADEQDPTAR